MKIIITGSSGMVGKGALLECIDDPRVTEVLLINRRPTEISHPKVKEVLHKDFRDFDPVREALKGYDACFHCMGVSAVGMSEEEYSEFTYDMTKALASTLKELDPNMVFIYVSGTGTDSSEKGKIMWARVKGRTENMVLNMGFKDAYAFRPGFILPERGITSRFRLYRYTYFITRPFFPLMRRMKSVTSTTAIGKAMINAVVRGTELKHLENRAINILSEDA